MIPDPSRLLKKKGNVSGSPSRKKIRGGDPIIQEAHPEPEVRNLLGKENGGARSRSDAQVRRAPELPIRLAVIAGQVRADMQAAVPVRQRRSTRKRSRRRSGRPRPSSQEPEVAGK